MAKIEPISHLEKVIVNCLGGGSSSGGASGGSSASSTPSNNYKYYIYLLSKDIANSGFTKLSDTYADATGRIYTLFKTKENKIDYVCFNNISIVNGYVKFEYEDGAIQEFPGRFNINCTLTGTNIKSITIGIDETRNTTSLSGFIIAGESIQPSTTAKEFRFVNLSDYKNNTDFVADSDGNYTYNLNNKTITNISFVGAFSARSGQLTFVGDNNFVLKQGSGITQGTQLKDTNFTGLTLTKGTNGVSVSGNMILTLE